ncbi:hypothetical protein LTR08_000050 [Meristemomyces frigidus]|nr:hypothetical protein LTR08_000050 [Meristemomyces frigidus]
MKGAPAPQPKPKGAAATPKSGGGGVKKGGKVVAKKSHALFPRIRPDSSSDEAGERSAPEDSSGAEDRRETGTAQGALRRKTRTKSMAGAATGKRSRKD